MNSSTLPPLLSNYLSSYEQKGTVTFARSDLVEEAPISEQLEQVKNGSNEVEKKPKHIKTVMSHKRHAEAEEKASKEREEKALHTLKMWNVVKENERRRKQRMLKDRVNLQHEMIRKQDELIQEKHQQQEKELQKQSSWARSRKQKMLVGLPQNARNEHVQRKNNNPLALKQTSNKTRKPKVVQEHANEEAPEKTYDDEKLSEVSQKDHFSEEDLSEFLEKSTMEEADFHDLRFQPLQVQLERLFGEEADGYLNPTVKESPRKVFDLALARKKGQQGAAALWEALRTYSRQKLVNKDALILPDVKNAYACFVRECLRRHITPVKRNFVSEEETPVNVNVEESDILKDVRYRRHRQELMYRIAHINKDKTKLLFQVIGQPHYSEVKDEDGIRRYYPEIAQEKNEEKPALIKLPEIHDKSRTGNAVGNTHLAKTKDQQFDNQPGRSKLLFLTEAKSTCRGQFAKRLNKEDKKESNLKQSAVVTTGVSKTPSPVYSQRLWEPLSMEALLDHNVSVLERRNEMRTLGPSQVWKVCT